MIFEQIPVHGDRNFAYLIGDETQNLAAVLDPAFEPETVLDRAAAHGLTVTLLINTHGHYDHTDGNDHVLEKTSARLAGFGLPGDGLSLRHGDALPVGSVTITILHTPGHTPDSICLLVENKLVTGDTLFVGKVGGTGFGDDARQLYDSLHQRILTLPDEVEIYPGHDYGVAPTSTVGHEKRTNPFLLPEDFEGFLHLKKNWLAYKLKHGIA